MRCPKFRSIVEPLVEVWTGGGNRYRQQLLHAHLLSTKVTEIIYFNWNCTEISSLMVFIPDRQMPCEMTLLL